MKKTTLIFVFGFFSILNKAYAQKTNFGVKAGINISNLTKTESDSKNLIGFHIGIISEIKFTDKVSLLPELLYSKQGVKTNSLGKLELDYITLPVLLKNNIVGGLSAQIGPQFAFLLEDIEKVSVFDFSTVIGVGYEINSLLFIQARYNLGITKIVNNSKNSVFQLSIVYKF